MNIKKCDLCKKEIKDNAESFNVRFPRFDTTDLCSTCALPILKFLKKNKIVDKEGKKIETN